MVPVLFTFYMQGVLKLKKNNSGAKRLMNHGSCIIHILDTGCAKIKKNNSGTKSLMNQVADIYGIAIDICRRGEQNHDSNKRKLESSVVCGRAYSVIRHLGKLNRLISSGNWRGSA